MPRFGRRTHRSASQRLNIAPRSVSARTARPQAAFRQRRPSERILSEGFGAPETWHEPAGRDLVKYRVEPAGDGYLHPVTTEEVTKRIALLPQKYLKNLEVVQFSRMTHKRALFPCYGMQWGTAVYLYPIEASLTETYVAPPRPEQIIEARMFGGRWEQDGRRWLLHWTEDAVRDFYLNNVLIHEIGHTVDDRNTRFLDRERYANWFAVEYGYRASRGRR